jgi:hypothetical protein
MGGRPGRPRSSLRPGHRCWAGVLCRRRRRRSGRHDRPAPARDRTDRVLPGRLACRPRHRRRQWPVYRGRPAFPRRRGYRHRRRAGLVQRSARHCRSTGDPGSARASREGILGRRGPAVPDWEPFPDACRPGARRRVAHRGRRRRGTGHAGKGDRHLDRRAVTSRRPSHGRCPSPAASRGPGRPGGPGLGRGRPAADAPGRSRRPPRAYRRPRATLDGARRRPHQGDSIAAYAAAASGHPFHFIARLYWPGMDPALMREALAVYAGQVIPAVARRSSRPTTCQGA